MKTVNQLKNRIDQIIRQGAGRLDKKTETALKKELETLQTALTYLESEPTMKFVEKQLFKVEKMIVKYKQHRLVFDGHLPDIRKEKIKILNKEFEITKLRKQKKALRYLLEQEYSIV